MRVLVTKYSLFRLDNNKNLIFISSPSVVYAGRWLEEPSHSHQLQRDVMVSCIHANTGARPSARPGAGPMHWASVRLMTKVL